MSTSSDHNGEEQHRVKPIENLDLVDSCTELEFDDIAELTAAMCQTPISLISVLQPTRGLFNAAVGLDVRKTPLDTSCCQWALELEDLLVVEDTREDSRFQSHPLVTGEPNIRFYAGMPLMVDDGVKVGTFSVMDVVARSLTENQRKALRVFARQIQTRIQLSLERRHLRSALAANDALMLGLQTRNHELSEVNRQLERLAATDPLTGLLNRREFERALRVEWHRSARSEKSLSLLMFDTDSFKSYNDLYGHLSGDSCLKQVAQAISTISPCLGGIAARFGGEEFVVLLPETDHLGAKALGESIRSAVKALRMEHKGSSHSVVTVSVGYATIEAKDELHHAMLTHAADLALYEAKRAGRNCVKTLQYANLTC